MNDYTEQEINILVAEKVMALGKTKMLPTYISQDSGERCIADAGELYPCYLPNYKHGATENIFWEAVPEYASKMSSAWKVVQKVLDLRYDQQDYRHRGGMPDCSLVFNPYTNEWRCTFNWSNDDPVSATHKSETMAICLASLRAVGSLI